jgi:hypothetical protein
MTSRRPHISLSKPVIVTALTLGAVGVSLMSLQRLHQAQAQTTSQNYTLTTQAIPADTVPQSSAAPLVVSESPSPAPNNNEFTLTAIPPRVGEEGGLRIKPGEKTQITLKVRNASAHPLTVDSLALDFILDEDGQTPVPVSDATSNRWSLTKWLTISPSSQTLAPNQIGQINVVIDVPTDALPGGHYAMVTHQPQLVSQPNASGQVLDLPSNAAINQRVGSLLYVIVDGPINEEAFVRDFHFPKLTEYGPVPFSLSIDNGSDVHIRPQIGIEIYNLLGKRVETLQLEPKNVFPLMSREFSGQWDKVWGSGFYKAKLTMSYGSGGRVVLASTNFWLIPYKLVAAGLVVLIVILGVMVLIRRHWLQHMATEQARVKKLEEKLASLEKNNHSSESDNR